MINWILTSSVLIVVILLIRKLFGEKLTPGIQYGLWLLVLIRLLIPVNFFHSSYSLEAAADKVMIWVWEKTLGEDTEYITVTEPETYVIYVSEEDIKYTPSDGVEKTDHTYIPAAREYDMESLFSGDYTVFYLIWLIGMAVTGGIFLLANLFFRIRIYSDREEVEEELEKRELFSKVPVYVSKFVTTPCLAGLKTPAVYIPLGIWEKNTDSGSDSEKNNGGKNSREKKSRELEAMLCHENMHYRHGDQLWGFLRLVCLILHWYNPFVWAAALASKQDGELFCDADAVRELGEENRYEYGRILLRMTMQEEGHFGGLSDSLGHAGLCNTEMTDTKRRMERRIRKLTEKPKKSTAAVMLTLLFSLMAFSYVFIGKEGQDSLFWKILSRNDTEQGEVLVKPGALPQKGLSEEFFVPSAEEVEEVREKALEGMSEEEIAVFLDYVTGYHNWLEGKLIYDNWEMELSDKENLDWKYIEETGEIMAGWSLDDDPEFYIEINEEVMKDLREKYPEYGQISLEELREKYGHPVYTYSWYGADTVIQRIKELTASAENEAFRTDVETFCEAVRQAKDDHEVSYMVKAHEIIHDMEYFLLRYGPRSVPFTVEDRSSMGKYYDALEVWKAWQENRL